VDTPLILERLYRLSPRTGPGRRRIFLRLRSRFVDWVKQHTPRLALASLVAVAWIVSHLYYYNMLVSQECDVLAAWAQIEATQQKREHVRRDLTQLVRYYADYERDVLKQVTTLRNKSPEAAAAPASPEQLIAKLDAVGEQYPSLNLARNVQQFSELITTTESEITERIVAYNNTVNVYTTTLNSFPGIVFGRVLGFREWTFYRPQDPSVLEYREVKP
jgi:LemA protein